MAELNQDFSCYANNDHTLEFSVVDKDANPSSPPALDLTGHTLKWAMSRLSSSGDFSKTPTVDKSTTGADMEIVDAAAGTVKVTLRAADTINLLGDFHHQLEDFDGGGNAVVVAEGKGTIKKNITNA